MTPTGGDQPGTGHGQGRSRQGWAEDLARRWVSARTGTLTEWVVASLDLNGQERVLDLGCGPGRTSQALLRRLPDGFVDAVESSPRLLRLAAARNRGAVDEGRLVLHRTVPLESPTRDAVFDVVLAVSSVYWFPRPSEQVAAALRALRPGGRLVLGLAHRHNLPDTWRAWMDRTALNTYRPRELHRLLTEAGFYEVREIWQPGDKWIAVNGTKPV